MSKKVNDLKDVLTEEEKEQFKKEIEESKELEDYLNTVEQIQEAIIEKRFDIGNEKYRKLADKLENYINERKEN